MGVISVVLKQSATAFSREDLCSLRRHLSLTHWDSRGAEAFACGPGQLPCGWPAGIHAGLD